MKKHSLAFLAILALGYATVAFATMVTGSGSSKSAACSEARSMCNKGAATDCACDKSDADGSYRCIVTCK